MPEKTTLTTGHARDLLQEVFPGAVLTVTDRLGGAVAQATIWLFTIEVSVTDRIIGVRDALGEARMVFTFRPPRMRATTIRQETTVSLDGLRVFVVDCREYLQGISAAIAVACDPS